MVYQIHKNKKKCKRKGLKNMSGKKKLELQKEIEFSKQQYQRFLEEKRNYFRLIDNTPLRKEKKKKMIHFDTPVKKLNETPDCYYVLNKIKETIKRKKKKNYMNNHGVSFDGINLFPEYENQNELNCMENEKEKEYKEYCKKMKDRFDISTSLSIDEYFNSKREIEL